MMHEILSDVSLYLALALFFAGMAAGLALGWAATVWGERQHEQRDDL